MSEDYISDAVFQSNANASLVLVLTLVSIAITITTAFIILPILHKIERSKEKVLMIYTELKKDQIESLNRNIRVFFMKLQSGASQVSGALSYQKSSRQFSGKLVTRKFTMKRAGASNVGDGDDYQFLVRGTSMAGIDMSGGNDMLELKSKAKSAKLKVSAHASGMGASMDPFAALFLPIEGSTANKEGENTPGGKSVRVNLLRGGAGRRKSSQGLNSPTKSKPMSDSSEVNSDEEDDKKSKKKKGGKLIGGEGDSEEEDLSENAVEDKRS